MATTRRLVAACRRLFEALSALKDMQACFGDLNDVTVHEKLTTGIAIILPRSDCCSIRGRSSALEEVPMFIDHARRHLAARILKRLEQGARDSDHGRDHRAA